jgi:hypothetical protein
MTGSWLLLLASGTIAATSGSQLLTSLVTGTIWGGDIGNIRRDYEPERFTRYLTMFSIVFAISMPFFVVALLAIIKG